MPKWYFVQFKAWTSPHSSIFSGIPCRWFCRYVLQVHEVAQPFPGRAALFCSRKVSPEPRQDQTQHDKPYWLVWEVPGVWDHSADIYAWEGAWVPHSMGCLGSLGQQEPSHASAVWGTLAQAKPLHGGSVLEENQWRRLYITLGIQGNCVMALFALGTAVLLKHFWQLSWWHLLSFYGALLQQQKWVGALDWPALSWADPRVGTQSIDRCLIHLLRRRAALVRDQSY